MKTIITKNILLFLLSIFLSNMVAAQKYTLTVYVEGIENISGKMEISLYNNQNDFPKDNKEFINKSVPVKYKIVKCEFYIPAGDYAIALYHDENNNDKCDRNIFGIPKEGVGFSNNIKPGLFAPSFQDCKIILDKNKQIHIKLLHF